MENYELKIAKVLEVSEINSDMNSVEQMVKLKIEGSDEEFYISNIIPDNPAFSIIAKKGKKYVVTMDQENGEVYISDYFREASVNSLLIIFISLVILFGGFRGIKAILSLILTGLSIVFIFIPAIQAGLNSILMAVLISMLSTAFTMILIAGFTRKSLAATIGTTGGVAVAGILSSLVIHFAPLSGLESSEARILFGNLNYGEAGSSIDFQGLLAAGIIIASLGAAMDVAISIASATQEIFNVDPKQSFRALYDHSINIGKDIMGTMTNTLILAYTGSSIPLFLLLYNESTLRIINMEIIATELTAALSGSIGLVCAIPVTALVSSLLYRAKASKLITEVL